MTEGITVILPYRNNLRCNNDAKITEKKFPYCVKISEMMINNLPIFRKFIFQAYLLDKRLILQQIVLFDYFKLRFLES